MELFDKIREWHKEKGIIDNSDTDKQLGKFEQELTELYGAIEYETKDHVKDELGDLVVVLTGIATMQGLKLEDCIEHAYNKISKRTGKMVDGLFVKD